VVPVGTAALLPVKSLAAVTSYADRAAWQAAAGGGAGDIFDNLNAGPGGSFSFSSLDSTLAVSNTNSTTDNDSTPYARLLLHGGEISNLTFFAPVVALGFDVNPWCSGNNCALSNSLGVQINALIDGILSGAYNLPSIHSAAFAGFFSDTAFTTFLVTTLGANGWHGMDNSRRFRRRPRSRSRQLFRCSAPAWPRSVSLGGVGNVPPDRRRIA
jgi:hypothetical protein